VVGKGMVKGWKGEGEARGERGNGIWRVKGRRGIEGRQRPATPTEKLIGLCSEPGAH